MHLLERNPVFPFACARNPRFLHLALVLDQRVAD